MPADSSAARWERVKDVVYGALQLDLQQRAAFLDAACASDTELRAEVDKMLVIAAEMRSGFLVSAPVEPAVVAGVLTEGQMFGEHLRLISRLGEGGMGQVWLAEQMAPVHRRVALKLIKAGMYDETFAQRLIAERQSLAIMDHPAIAKVYDAGTTPQGQPYFIMEYVPGLPITEYCDSMKLALRERIELFIKACDGVQHAHLKAVIHRDLKPPNILVITVDGKPLPKIIDFGLAKAAAPGVGHAQQTRFGLLMGTPGYMSPEQLSASAEDIDTRTDVYSLGVVLYVLLTGLQPFETKLRQKSPPDVWLRQLREEEPPRPSAKLSADRETSTITAEQRGTEPKNLITQLRGDLDWIALKAVERDRERRYATPAELAADLRRCLSHEPVQARPASTPYRVGKYVRRHRVGVAAAAGLLLLLATFSALQWRELRRTAEERDRATRITDFMTSMFKVSDPSVARGNSVTAREILDKASKDMQNGLAQDPLVQSQMLQVMATTYLNLGLYARAHELAGAALSSRLALLGPDNRDTLASGAMVAWLTELEGHFPEAEQLERQALAAQRRVLGLDDPLTLDTMDKLGATLGREYQFVEEESIEREVVQATTRRFGADGAQTLRARNHLAASIGGQGHVVEAEKEYRRLLDDDRRVLGADDPDTLRASNNLAMTLDQQGRWTEAEPLFRENLAKQQRILGPEHDTTVATREQLAWLLYNEGHAAEAESLDRDTWNIRSRNLGADHPSTARSEFEVGADLFREGRLAQAEPLEREAFELHRRAVGPAHGMTIHMETLLAKLLNHEGRWTEAEPLAREAFDLALPKQDKDDISYALRELAISMEHAHRSGEADKMFRDMIDKQGSPEDRSSLWFSYACAALAGGDQEGALRHLREAISTGYHNVTELSFDEDLEPLRTNPDFQQLLEELKRGPAANAH
jgi:eukaryotic-like serine/threonine-protein kinase